jgi:hypothetical protein
MPHISRDAHNAYFREYNKQRWLTRRTALIEMLGGVCAKTGCGVTEALEFDHIDPALKSFTLANKPLIAWDRLVAEAMKCQVLCNLHHKEKTRADRLARKEIQSRVAQQAERPAVTREVVGSKPAARARQQRSGQGFGP